jgi:hypothetical protein
VSTTQRDLRSNFTIAVRLNQHPGPEKKVCHLSSMGPFHVPPRLADQEMLFEAPAPALAPAVPNQNDLNQQEEQSLRT